MHGKCRPDKLTHIITSNIHRGQEGEPLAPADPKPHPAINPLTYFLTGRKLEPKPRAATSMARYPMAASLTGMVEVDMGWSGSWAEAAEGWWLVLRRAGWEGSV